MSVLLVFANNWTNKKGMAVVLSDDTTRIPWNCLTEKLVFVFYVMPKIEIPDYYSHEEMLDSVS